MSLYPCRQCGERSGRVTQLYPQLGKLKRGQSGVLLQILKSPVRSRGGLRLEHGIGEPFKLLGTDPGGLGNLIQPGNLRLERTGRQRYLRRLQFPRDLVDAPSKIRLGNRVAYALGNGFALLFGNQFGVVQVGFKRGVITTDRYINAGCLSCHASLPIWTDTVIFTDED